MPKMFYKIGIFLIYTDKSLSEEFILIVVFIIHKFVGIIQQFVGQRSSFWGFFIHAVRLKNELSRAQAAPRLRKCAQNFN